MEIDFFRRYNKLVVIIQREEPPLNDTVLYQ